MQGPSSNSSNGLKLTLVLAMTLLACKQARGLLGDKQGAEPAASAAVAAPPSAAAVVSASAKPAPPLKLEPPFVKQFPSVEKVDCRLKGKDKWGHINWGGGKLFDQDPAWIYWVDERTIGRVRKSDGKREILHRANLGPRDKVGDISVYDEGLYFTMKDALYLLPRIPGEHKPGFPKPDPKLVVEKFGMPLAEDATHFYAARSEDNDKGGKDDAIIDIISKVRKDGTGLEEVFRTTRKQAKYPPFGFSALVVDANHIYAANATRYELFKIPKAGGEVQNILDSRQRIPLMQADNDNLYYTVEYTTEGVKQLRKLAKTGGESQVLASVLPEEPFVVAEDALYIMKLVQDENKVYPTRLDKGGKELRSFGNTTRPPIAIDDQCLYVTYLDVNHEYISAHGLVD